MKITKAVIPAAGFGTRVLPATKNVPKEMFPIVDKPTIQYIVEEAVAAGITDILIITNRGKSIMADHFDRSPELEHILEKSGKMDFLKCVKDIAVLCIIALSAFAIRSAMSCRSSFYMIAACSATTMLIFQTALNVFGCTDMKEKPKTKEEVLSLYSILDRCVLPPEIFEILERTKPGVGGEIQLTDAMREIAITKGMTAVEFEGTRYDMGNKFGILKAQIEVGLEHPETKDQLKKYIKELAEKL